MRWLVFALVAGCTASPQQAVGDVCNAFCDCRETTPFLINQCLEQCVPQLTTITVTTTCSECVDSHEATCAGLLSSCENECFTSVATPDTKGSR